MLHLLLRILVLLCQLLLLAACSGKTKISSVTVSSIELNEKNKITDSATYYTIAPYKEKMDRIMNEVLGVSDTSLTKDLPESSLGNFVSDAVLSRINSVSTSYKIMPADICLLNNGGLRAQLPKGEITRRNVFELMPFENKIVVLTLSGKQTQEMFEYIVASNGAPFSGAKIKATGKKISALFIQGSPFDPGKNYRIVTSDYLAAGGDKYTFFKDPLYTDTVNYLLRDVIIDQIKSLSASGKKISSKKDGRIIYE
jgi:2',3'-cyclic-nucleotide 2'-phosphodiesterase (5'-nucleotidase family)